MCVWLRKRRNSMFASMAMLATLLVPFPEGVAGSRKGPNGHMQEHRGRPEGYGADNFPGWPIGQQFAYTAPSGARAFTVCSCAKCGSTSLYSSLFEAIYGLPFPTINTYDREVQQWVSARESRPGVQPGHIGWWLRLHSDGRGNARLSTYLHTVAHTTCNTPRMHVRNVGSKSR